MLPTLLSRSFPFVCKIGECSFFPCCAIDSSSLPLRKHRDPQSRELFQQIIIAINPLSSSKHIDVTFNDHRVSIISFRWNEENEYFYRHLYPKITVKTCPIEFSLPNHSNINQKLGKIVHKPGTIKLEKLTEIPNENIFRHR